MKCSPFLTSSTTELDYCCGDFIFKIYDNNINVYFYVLSPSTLPGLLGEKIEEEALFYK